VNQRAFAIDVLGMLGNDYEAPQTIAGDLSLDLGRPVSEAEVRAALLELSLKGWAQAFRFEAASRQYVEIEAAEAAHEQSSWFMATKNGMAAYENTAS
jgi:hypothetical protein